MFDRVASLATGFLARAWFVVVRGQLIPIKFQISQRVINLVSEGVRIKVAECRMAEAHNMCGRFAGAAPWSSCVSRRQAKFNLENRAA